MTQCFQITPFQLGQFHADQAALEARFTNFWAGLSYPVRLLSRTHRWSIAPIQQRLRRAIGPLEDVIDVLPLLNAALTDPAAFPQLRSEVRRRQDALARAVTLLPEAAVITRMLDGIAAGDTTPDQLQQLDDAFRRAAWPWRWLKNQRRMYHTIEDTAPPLAIDHYLLAWPDAHVHPGTLAQTLKQVFLLPDVTPTPFPPLFHGRYREEADYLHPCDPGYPYLAVLTAWDLRGDWDLATLAPLLMGEYAVTLAIDVQTLPRGQALRKTTDAFATLQQAVFGRYATKDARSERALAAANHTLSQLDMQALHEVAYALLVEAPTLPALNRQIQTLQDLLGVRLRLERLRGAQAAYLHLFTPQPSRAIRLPLVRRNTLSHGVAVRTPWGLRKTTRTDGIFWGYDLDEGMPIHYDPFGASGYDNAHTLVVGRSGSGKTVTYLALLNRMAAAGYQVVYFDPVGKGNLLADAVGPGAAYYDVATDAAINILDPMSDTLHQQVRIVADKLSLLLGHTEQRGGRIHYTPRTLGNFELGALDLACRTDHLYGHDGERLRELTPATAPVLEVLVAALRAVAKAQNLPEAADLAREIELVLLGSRADLFNRRTTLKWDFASQVTAYNFKHADPALLPLYYVHGLGELDRWVRSAERAQRGQPLYVAFDEYYILATFRELEAIVAKAIKSWRNYRAGVAPGDQNISTFTGQAGTPNEYGPFITNNTLIKLFFRQEGSEADLLGALYQDQLTPTHLQFIRTASVGECLALLGDEVHRLSIQLSDLEAAYFLKTTTQ